MTKTDRDIISKLTEAVSSLHTELVSLRETVNRQSGNHYHYRVWINECYDFYTNILYNAGDYIHCGDDYYKIRFIDHYPELELILLQVMWVKERHDTSALVFNLTEKSIVHDKN